MEGREELKTSHEDNILSLIKTRNFSLKNPKTYYLDFGKELGEIFPKPAQFNDS